MANQLIHLWKDYYIKVNDNQFTLFRKRLGQDKDGNEKEHEVFLGHWTHLENLVQQVIRVEQSNAELTNIYELVSFTQKVIGELKEVIRKATYLEIK
jgi:hypothetical protein